MAILRTTCCIAGGGPAGMMLGFLLARAGIEVVVLEKHADFLRDFRGDTVHPSTLELMHELGLLDEFLLRPHRKVAKLTINIGGEQVDLGDFSYVPTHCKFIALMPQWDFLDFIADHARDYGGFDLRMNAEVINLVLDQNGQVIGVMAETPDGPLEVRAALVVGCDGRGSIVREKAGLPVQDLGAPMDVLWFALPRRADDPEGLQGCFDTGRLVALIDRGDYWQCGYVIAKGAADQVRQQGLAEFQSDLARLVPFLADRVSEIRSWDQVKLLTVRVDRLRQWHRPGLLCIGDAAHAMSPAGGVGINLAVQDAVAAANILAGCTDQSSGHRAGPGEGAAPAPMADARDPMAAGRHAAARDQPRADRHGPAPSAGGPAPVPALSLAARPARPAGRRRPASRTYPHAGRQAPGPALAGMAER